jgi:uncharacterized protein YkwD
MNPQFPHGRVELTRPEWQRDEANKSGVIWLSVGSGWLTYRAPDTYEPIGTEVEVLPQLINGRTIVPVRAIAEMTGFGVDWNNDEFIVDIYTDRQSIPTPPLTQMAGLENAIRDGLWLSEIRQLFPDARNEEIQALLEQEVIRLVNEIRREHGLNELIPHEGVARSARSRAETIIQHGRHPEDAHRCPITGIDATEHTRQYAPDIRAVENYAKVTARSAAVVNTWMGSRGHREYGILRTPATYIGVGVAFHPDMLDGATWILRVGRLDR